MTQTITALFDRPAEAQAAQAKLVAAGIPQSAIKLVQGAQTARTSGSYDYHKDEGGFWGSLKDFFMPEEDRYSYSEGLSRGGTMLSASVDDTKVDTAIDILEEHGSVNMDEREASWRKEGWAGYAGSSTGASTGGTASTSTNPGMLRAAEAAGGIPATGQTVGTGGRTTAADLGAGGTTGTAGARSTAAGDKEYIPIVEEQLN